MEAATHSLRRAPCLGAAGGQGQMGLLKVRLEALQCLWASEGDGTLTEPWGVGISSTQLFPGGPILSLQRCRAQVGLVRLEEPPVTK